jgi:hypothetical protein
MLDALLKLVDKVIDWSKIRNKRLRVRYDEIYKGAFADLQTIHSDYLQLLNAASRGLKTLPTNADSDSEQAKFILSSLEEGRVKCWAIRRSLVQLGAFERWSEQEISSFHKSEVHFIRMLRWYFEVVQASAGETSLTVNLIEALKSALRQEERLADARPLPPTIPEVREWCDATISELNRRWAKTAEAFVRLRFDLAGRAS